MRKFSYAESLGGFLFLKNLMLPKPPADLLKLFSSKKFMSLAVLHTSAIMSPEESDLPKNILLLIGAGCHSRSHLRFNYTLDDLG